MESERPTGGLTTLTMAIYTGLPSRRRVSGRIWPGLLGRIFRMLDKFPHDNKRGDIANIMPAWRTDARRYQGDRGWVTVKPELRSWYGKLDQSFDRQQVGKATPGKFCARWWQARRARSDAPYQRWARDMVSISLPTSEFGLNPKSEID